eukprot:Em0003g184a
MDLKDLLAVHPIQETGDPLDEVGHYSTRMLRVKVQEKRSRSTCYAQLESESPQCLTNCNGLLMSGLQPGLNLFKAVKEPPAKHFDTWIGTLPDANRFTTLRREEQIGVGSGILAASMRCWTRIPEGPAAVPFGKDLRTARISISRPRDAGV